MRLSTPLLLLLSSLPSSRSFLPLLPALQIKLSPAHYSSTLNSATADAPPSLEGLSDTENLSKDIVIKRTIEEKHNVRSIVKFAVPGETRSENARMKGGGGEATTFFCRYAILTY